MKTGFIAGAMLAMLLSGALAVAGDAVKGKEKSMLCAGCHGVAGISVTPIIPNLAGQKEQYLVKAINDYGAGKRKDPMMSSIAQGLNDEAIADLAAYFSQLGATQ